MSTLSDPVLSVESPDTHCNACGCREQFDFGLCEACCQVYEEDTAQIAAEQSAPVQLVEYRAGRRIVTAVVDELYANGLWSRIRVVAVDGPSGWIVNECYGVPTASLKPAKEAF